MRLGVTAVATASTSNSALPSTASRGRLDRHRLPRNQPSSHAMLPSRCSGTHAGLLCPSARCRARKRSATVFASRSNPSSTSSKPSSPSSPEEQRTSFEARSRVGRPAPVRQEFLDACEKIGMPHPSAWLFDPETGLALIRKRLTYSELLRDVRLGRIRSVALFDSEHKLYDAFETDFYGEDGRTPPTEDGAAIVQYREGYVDGDDSSDANVISEDDPALNPLPRAPSPADLDDVDPDRSPGILATATVPPHDARLAAAFEAHGVTVGRLPSPGDETSILLRKPAVPSPARARFFKALPYLFVLGAYLATQVAAWMKGDYLDRAALRKADIAREKAQAEQARRDEARLELEELAASGYSAEAILAEARRVGRPAKEAYVRALVEAAKEGKAGGSATKGEKEPVVGEKEFAGDAQQYAEALRAAALAKLAKMAGGSDSAEAGEAQIGKLSTVQIQAAGGGDAAKAEADAAIWDDDASGAALRAAQRKLKGVKLQYIGSGRVLFSDVAGVEGAKRELAEVVDFFTKPQKFRASGARVPRGVLLVGPPGTGKTLLARAVAGEAGVSFLSLNASEFVEMFVGVGASRVRDLFAQARSMAPAVIFIDEIDAVGRKRGGAQGNDERDATLNQLLTEMDGFTTEQDVVVIGATNRVDVLDDALTRPGRFDRIATVEEADAAGRVAILKLHLGWEEGEGGDNRSDGRAREEFVLDEEGKPTKVRAPRHRRCDDSVNLKRLADDTLGFSGAALAALVNDAALRAARDGREAISMEDLEESLEEDLMGPLRAPFEDARGPRVALVEATAAVAAVLLSPPLERLVEVTIRPRDKWPYGQTVLEADDDREGANLYTRKYLLAQLVESLAPYAAERLFRGPDAQSMLASRRLATGRRIVDRMVAGAGIAQGGFSALNEKDDFLREIAGRDAPFPRRNQNDVYSDASSRLLGGEWRTVAVPAWFGGRSLAQAVPSRVSRATQAAAAADAQALFEEGLAAADALVERNRDAIEAVASALLEKQILDGDEVRRLVELKGDAEDVARTKRERGVFY